MEELFASSPNDSVLDEINIIKNELESEHLLKTKGVIIRSRLRWYEKGEKSTKYFLNLEKRRANTKSLSKLINERNEEITDQRQILQEEKMFYEKLYKSRNLMNDNETEKLFFQSGTLPKLDETSKLTIDKAITEDALANSLKLCPNNRSPGSDGLPYEFYKMFWPEIKKYLTDAINYAFEHDSLSFSQKQGIINLIPKKRKKYPLS